MLRRPAFAPYVPGPAPTRGPPAVPSQEWRSWWFVGGGQCMAIPPDLARRWRDEGRAVVFDTYRSAYENAKNGAGRTTGEREQIGQGLGPSRSALSGETHAVDRPPANAADVAVCGTATGGSQAQGAVETDGCRVGELDRELVDPGGQRAIPVGGNAIGQLDLFAA